MTWYVVDGMDGVGKTTVAGMLAAELESKGRRVKVVHHPNRETRLGRASARCLTGQGAPSMAAATMLYFLDMVHSLMTKYRQREQYDDIVFVRYTLSICYLPERIYMQAYRGLSAVLPSPDVCVYVDADECTAMGRIDVREDEREMFESDDGLRTVRDKMLSVIDMDWEYIDNSGELSDTLESVTDLLNR